MVPSNSLDFGYAFEPPAPASHPGHRRLTVVLRPHPTERHYDPERADWPVVTAYHELDRLALFHPWPVSGEHRAAPGRIILTDRKAKVVQAFTFGGTLRVDASDERVVAVLESPAPILPLLPPHDIAEFLADEVDILLARRRAYWDQQRQPHAADGFEERLARVEPLPLYQACLATVRDQLAHTPSLFHDTEHRLAAFLRHEIASLDQAGHWPLHVPTLEQLL
jgi:hypothetical protein